LARLASNAFRLDRPSLAKVRLMVATLRPTWAAIRRMGIAQRLLTKFSALADVVDGGDGCVHAEAPGSFRLDG